MGIALLCRLRLADIAEGNGQSIPELHHLTAQPCRLDGVIVYGELFIQRLSGIDHLAEPGKHRARRHDRRQRAQRLTQQIGPWPPRQPFGIRVHIEKTEVNNLARVVPYGLEEAKRIQARIPRCQKLRVRLPGAS